MYMCMCSYSQTGMHVCKHMYVYAHEEQGTTARSRDTRAPAARGIASNARLCCLLPVQDGFTALMSASQKGHTATAAKLIAAGAKVDVQSKVREGGGACGSCCSSMCVVFVICVCVIGDLYMCVCVHVCVCVCACAHACVYISCM